MNAQSAKSERSGSVGFRRIILATHELERGERRQRSFRMGNAGLQNLAEFFWRALRTVRRLDWLALLRLVLRTQSRSGHRNCSALVTCIQFRAFLERLTGRKNTRIDAKDTPIGPICVFLTHIGEDFFVALCRPFRACPDRVLTQGGATLCPGLSYFRPFRPQGLREGTRVSSSPLEVQGEGRKKTAKTGEIPGRKVAKVGKSYLKLLEVGSPKFFKMLRWQTVARFRSMKPFQGIGNFRTSTRRSPSLVCKGWSTPGSMIESRWDSGKRGRARCQMNSRASFECLTSQRGLPKLRPLSL